ncbi:hypothetical protein V6O07_15240, partial [Arthrospira platensis SPKY2]
MSRTQLAAAALVAACLPALAGLKPAHAQTLPRPEPESAFAPLVQLHVVGQDDELLEIPGRVQAAQRSDLAFQVPGLLI